MHFTRLELWAAYFLLVGLMLTSWTLWKNRERIRDWRNRYDSWDDGQPDVYDIAGDDEPEVHHEPERLPDADTRTMRLQQLADPCPSCGGDCGEICDRTPGAELTEAIPVLEGTIVARAEVILAETRREWTWVLGQWLPPSDALDGLETGSWLRDLLVSA
jgi:hypothetical protein